MSFAAIQPRRLELGRSDVPVEPAPARNLAHVLAKFFQRRAAEEPVTVVDLVDHQARLKNGEWAPTPVRYSLVSVMLSVLIVTNLQ